jgi:WD40 repeat protein
MQTLEVYIEENVHGSVRPVEIVADAPVAVLVPALVEELQLPKADIFGKPLVYMLRYALNGRILPEQKTLLASGVGQGTQLVLDSYIVDGSVATMMEKNTAQAAPDALFHSSDTANDKTGLPTVGDSSSSSSRDKGRVRRRTFLAIGGVVLGAATIGTGYAALRGFNKGALNTTNMTGGRMSKPPKAPPPTTPMIPTMAKTSVVFTGHQQTVRTVVWSPDGTMLASGADDSQLLLWNTNGTIHQTIAHPAAVNAAAWSPDSKRLVTGSNNQVLFLNAMTGMQLALSTHRHTANVTSLAWTGKNQQLQVVSGGADNRAIVWDTTNYHSHTIFTRHTAPIESVSWAPDGQTIASSSQGGAVRVWNAANGQELHAYYLDAPIRMRALEYAPMGAMLVVGGEDGIVRFWNADTCQKQAIVNGLRQCVDVPQRVQAFKTPVRSLAWSPDGKFLAVGSNDGVFTLWYPQQSQQPLLSMPIQQNTPVHSISWAPKGNQLAVAVGNSVTLLTLM